MITISKKQIDKIFNKEILPFVTCIGIDTASRSGWCKATTDPDKIRLDCGFIDIDSKDKYFKYNRYVEIFSRMFTKDMIVIIEESFYGKNVKTFQMLSRLGGFAYAAAHLVGVRCKMFLLATTARKYLGFKGNLKKNLIQEEFIKKLDLEIDDPDIIDAIILALNGVLVPNQTTLE